MLTRAGPNEKLKSWILSMKKIQKYCNQFYSLFVCTQEEYEISEAW